MNLFSKQKIYCQACGKPFETRCGGPFGTYFPLTCSNECRLELAWRYTLSVMGKEYRPQEAERAGVQREVSEAATEGQ